MDLPLDEQRSAHIARAERVLGIPVSGLIPSPNTTAFRARIELTPGNDGILGYRSSRSHRAVAVNQCAVARPEINAVLPRLGPVPRFIERVSFRSDGSRVVVHVKTTDRNKKKAVHWVNGLPDIGAAVALNGRGLTGDASTSLTVEGIEHQFSPATFYQVNLEINALLVADVVSEVERASPTAILDLFSGAGNLSLPLVNRGHTVTMMESHPTATKDGRKTATRLGLRVDVQTKRAEDYQAGDVFFDVAILDPPRKGAGAVMEQILMTRPKLVVMVSCNPNTLAADLKRAATLGYTMDSVRLYEMFPHSGHIEAMGTLSAR
jgi:tRNA/tmRNA/rRNA uracil-C5-methylase (TrmA/RlmC/RlmD family)